MSNDQNAVSHSPDKTVTVIVNGKPKVVDKGELSYAQVVALAFDTPPTGDGVQFSVQYTRGHNDNPKDSLVEGQSVKVKEGMEFDVTPTNRS
jgi:hypothetical protein